MPILPDAAAQAGAKRKRPVSTKFYAVRAGHAPGVYKSWSECLNQVKGFKGALFKSFPTLTEAESFISGEGTDHSASSSHRFYAVRRGRISGVYTDWPSAQKQITGWTKPEYRGFSTLAEAEKFMQGGTNASDNLRPHEVEVLQSKISAEEEPVPKKQRSAGSGNSTPKTGRVPSHGVTSDGYEAGLSLPPGSEDGFDTNIILQKGTSHVVFKSSSQRQATKLQARSLSANSMVRIYTDGSSLGNGQKGAFAGVGVFFGPLDSRNISEPLPGPRQTNQRAELTAIVRALDTAPKDIDVTIVTDSEYAINCSTKWHQSWKKNGWKTAGGKSVENRDIIEIIVGKVEERAALQSKTLFEWIKGHANLAGNVEADKLAVNGAHKAAQMSLEE